MWNYSHAQRFLPPVPVPSPGPQSTHELLVSLRGTPLSVRCPTWEGLLPGFLEDVSARKLSLGLAKPATGVTAGALLTVEIIARVVFHRFEPKVLSVAAAGTWLQVSMPHQVESVQRRQFTRVQMMAPLVFARTSGENGLGQTLDLSPGGLRFTTQTSLAPGHHLFLSFTTPDGANFRGIEAAVMRVQSSSDKHTVAVQFSDLEPETEASMVDTILRLQGKR